MKYVQRASQRRVRILTAVGLLASTAVTFLQVHDDRGGLFGFHISSIGAEHLLLVMLLAIGAALILAQGLFRGRMLAHRLVLVLSVLFGLGALFTGPTFGTIIDTLVCASLLFALINYSSSFDVRPNPRIVIRNLIIGLLVTIALWSTGTRVMVVSNFDTPSYMEGLRLSALWLAGAPLDELTNLTPLSETLLSIALIIWVMYLIRTFFVIILSADDIALIRRERAWIHRLLLRPSRRDRADYTG